MPIGTLIELCTCATLNVDYDGCVAGLICLGLLVLIRVFYVCCVF